VIPRHFFAKEKVYSHHLFEVKFNAIQLMIDRLDLGQIENIADQRGKTDTVFRPLDL
jgi:hypothetical protein